MHRILLKDHYWRNSQLSVEKYVKNCAVCISQTTFPSVPLLLSNSNRSNPWKNVEFHWLEPCLHSHLNNNNCLAVIYDPASLWLSASAIPLNPFEISLFMFENFCNHGLVSCSLYGIDHHTFEQISLQ